ncbi:hypothetical protein ACLBWX_04390 [Methylobacterium sp. M6A4_1b]
MSDGTQVLAKGFDAMQIVGIGSTRTGHSVQGALSLAGIPGTIAAQEIEGGSDVRFRSTAARIADPERVPVHP